MKLLWLAGLGLVSFHAVADAYRCVEGGRVVISNVPCTATKVIRSEDPDPLFVDQANRETRRQQAYVSAREAHNREVDRRLQRQAEEYARLHPETPERPTLRSPPLAFPGCGLGGSCPTTRTISR